MNITEREIAIGFIVSKEYLDELQEIWNPAFLESNTARTLSNWCWEFYKRHEKAPYKKIHSIFLKKAKKGKMDESLAEEIETEILQSLSDDFSNKDFDVDVLIEETKEYFIKRHAEIHTENVQALIDKDEIEKAIKLQENYTPLSVEEDTSIELTDKEQNEKATREAHKQKEKPLIKYKGAFGELLNNELIRGRFVAILAKAKMGKSYVLLDMAMKAFKQGNKVVFFQAGDMTEADQMIRIGSYITKAPSQEEGLGEQYIAARDCVWNQIDDCRQKYRGARNGVFIDKSFSSILQNPPNKEQLINAYLENPDYKRCWHCPDYKKNNWGTPFLRKARYRKELSLEMQLDANEKWFYNNKNGFKLDTYANGELNANKIANFLNKAKKDGFIPDVVFIDYMDLLVTNAGGDYRNNTNEVWKQMRSISQKFNVLVVAPTQSDAKAHKAKVITEDNFSEDVRKNQHVTAIIGLNQDPKGWEKSLGVLRFNKILTRNGAFDPYKTVTVLQNLYISRPILESYHTPIPPSKEEEKDEESSE